MSGEHTEGRKANADALRQEKHDAQETSLPVWLEESERKREK